MEVSGDQTCDNYLCFWKTAIGFFLFLNHSELNFKKEKTKQTPQMLNKQQQNPPKPKILPLPPV